MLRVNRSLVKLQLLGLLHEPVVVVTSVLARDQMQTKGEHHDDDGVGSDADDNGSVDDDDDDGIKVFYDHYDDDHDHHSFDYFL